jgi:adenylate cyclase
MRPPRRLRLALAVTLSSAALAHALAFALPKQAEAWNGRIIDLLFGVRSWMPRAWPPPGPVAYVEISDKSRQAMGVSYVGRADYARVITNLAALAPAAIAVDVVFAGRLDEGDEALVTATRTSGQVYYGMAFDPSLPPNAGPPVASDWLEAAGWAVPVEGRGSLPEGHQPYLSYMDLAARSRGLGLLNVQQDADGVHRTLPLLFQYAGRVYPTLALRVFADAVGAEPSGIRIVLGDRIELRASARTAIVPIDRQGRLRMNFPAEWDSNRLPHYRFENLWGGFPNRDAKEQWQDELRDRFVVLCDVSTGSDVGPTAIDPRLPLPALHATALSMMLTGTYLPDAPPIARVGLEIGLLGLLVFAAVRASSAGFLATAIGLAALLASVITASFLYYHRVIPPLEPAFGLAASTAAMLGARYLAEDRERQLLKRTFSMYFPPAMVERIIANPTFVTEGGEKRELTIMFSDIQGFTTRTAAAQPDEIRHFLNGYFSEMVEIVFAHGGTVDKFIGDGLMAFFGAPDAQPDHADRAVAAAIAMQQCIARSAGRWVIGKDDGPLRVRIGLTTGSVVVGNMGSSRRLSYTVLGASVNLAQRLESNAPPGGILISSRCRELLESDVETRPCGAIPIKGLGEKVHVFEVVIPVATGS